MASGGGTGEPQQQQQPGMDGGQVSSVWAALANMQFGPQAAFVGPAWGQFPTCHMCLKVITDSRDVPVRDEDALISVIIRMAAFPGSRLASRPPRHSRLCRPCYDHLKRVKEGLVSKALLDRVRVLVSPWWSAPPPPSNGGPMARPHSPPLCPGFMDTDVDPNIRRRLIRSLNAECVDRVEKTIGEYVELNIELHRKLAAQKTGSSQQQNGSSSTAEDALAGGTTTPEGRQASSKTTREDMPVLLPRASPARRGANANKYLYAPTRNADETYDDKTQPDASKSTKRQPTTRVVVRGPVINVPGDNAVRSIRGPLTVPFTPHHDGAFRKQSSSSLSQKDAEDGTATPTVGSPTQQHQKDSQQPPDLSLAPAAAPLETNDDNTTQEKPPQRKLSVKGQHQVHPEAAPPQRHVPVPLVVPPRGKFVDDGLASPRTGRQNFNGEYRDQFRDSRGSRSSYQDDDHLYEYPKDNRQNSGDEDTAAAVALLGHLAAAHQYNPHAYHHAQQHYPPAYPYVPGQGHPTLPPPHVLQAPRYDQIHPQAYAAAHFRRPQTSIPVFPVRDEDMPPVGVNKAVVKN